MTSRPLFAIVALALVAPASAQELPSIGDPLELERYVDRVGDEAILEPLTGEGALEVRLAAVRASRWLDAPERALDPLAVLAAGDDPDLAPAAAAAGYRIALALDVDALTQRELDPSSLADRAPPWQAVADDESARADIRRLAALVASMLGSLAGSAPVE